jgi:mutator protein MutT
MTKNYTIYETPPSDFSQETQGAGCYCEWEEKLLFLKRHPNKPQGNTWGIPGGKLEKGESPRDAVIREVQEEIGLAIDTPELLEVGKLFIRLTHIEYVFHIFRFRFEEKPLLNVALDEHVEEKWLQFDQALQLPLILGGIEALKFYDKRIKLK